MQAVVPIHRIHPHGVGHTDLNFVILSLVAFAVALVLSFTASAEGQSAPRRSLVAFVEANCLECHDGEGAEAGLDLGTLNFDLAKREVFDRWVLIHDRVRDGEMPPPDDGVPTSIAPIGWSTQPVESHIGDDSTSDKESYRQSLILMADMLGQYDRNKIATTGRSKVRRLNRFEYENALRDVLDAPWLEISHLLPEDSVGHLFNKSGDRLDVSHVHLTRYLEVAERAIRLAMNAAAHESKTRKFYAREESTLQNYLQYRFGQMDATRSIVPLLGLESEPDVIRGKQAMTVGEADPQKRELEAMGVFSGTYSATTKYDFTRIDAPTDGRYRLRFKTYTFMAGPNGANRGGDHGLTGGDRAWWRPNRNVILPGTRSEPVTLYALASSGDSRWLTTFDSHQEPTVFESVVTLRKGENIRPDAGRLVRTRPGFRGNPNATQEGIPGFAMNWLEVEGPLHDSWPPKSFQALFDDLPFETTDDGRVRVKSKRGEEDARRLLKQLYQRSQNRLIRSNKTSDYVAVEPYVKIFNRAIELEQSFTDAMVGAAAALLCSPEFLYLESTPGPLSEQAFRERLSYFLWNGPPNDLVVAAGNPKSEKGGLRQANDDLVRVVNRMLDDPRSDRFVTSFLDYWLDLRDINSNTPDATLYPDYYLDELLTESSVLETKMFFRELIDKDLPVRNVIDSDFVFVNQRLAEHYGLAEDYGLAEVEGVGLRRVELPADSVRGGLLTQSSLLRVTANGTTTSPVVRGAWAMERILGEDIPSPPSGVDAVEPDTRGTKTIRQQLDKHRSIATCNACHARFDPVGLALESFDVTGGWRDRYRALGDTGEPAEGVGKNGHKFEFRHAQPVDSSGKLLNGKTFKDIRDLKRLLASDERQVARNLLHQFIVFATGTPVSFADRAEVETMLDLAADSDFGVRSLIHALVQSELFRRK